MDEISPLERQIIRDIEYAREARRRKKKSEPKYGGKGRRTLHAKTASAPKGFGYVYVIHAYGDWYKIGRTINVSHRLRSIQVSLPEIATLICSTLTSRPRHAERELHQKYASKRGCGEWFNLSLNDIKEIEDDLKFWDDAHWATTGRNSVDSG